LVLLGVDGQLSAEQLTTLQVGVTRARVIR